MDDVGLVEADGGGAFASGQGVVVADDLLGANARLRHIISKVAVLKLGEEQAEVRLNVSMGSAAYSSAEQLQNAIDAADAMMYREKHRKKQKRAQHTDVLQP